MNKKSLKELEGLLKEIKSNNEEFVRMFEKDDNPQV